MSEKETNTQEQEAPVKGKRNFGNTIVLFIVFFIIFTILVTGVAFFADKLKGGSKEAKLTEEQMKQQMTDPDSGKEQAYVVDDKGNVAKQEEAPKEEPQPAAAPDEPVLSAPPVETVKPEEPVKAPEPVKPEPVKAQAPKETVKPAVKETPKPAVKNTAPKAEAPKSVEKKETAKPAVKSEAPKAAPKKTEAKPAVKVTPVIPGEYHVQLASFKNFELAESEYHRLRSKVSDLQLVKVDLGEKGVWYRLRCGTGLSHESAKARAEQIKALTGYNPDIMK
ncbi:MAG: SPOR domain-containing protein [Deferribacterales bacterium]